MRFGCGLHAECMRLSGVSVRAISDLGRGTHLAAGGTLCPADGQYMRKNYGRWSVPSKLGRTGLRRERYRLTSASVQP